MLMKELEGTKIKIRSRLYRYLLVAFWDEVDWNHVYEAESGFLKAQEREELYIKTKQNYDDLTLQQLLDKLNVQHPEEIKQFRCLGDGAVAELKKLLKVTE